MSALPATARAISRATTEAVEAARAADLEAFTTATDELAACEPEQVRLALGVVVRDLLEHLHPDGLAGDDLQELIRSCVKRVFAWYPTVDVNALVIVITGALGMQEEDEPRYSPAGIARHAPLFIAELLSQPRPTLTVQQYLAQAFQQIRTSELHEMP